MPNRRSWIRRTSIVAAVAWSAATAAHDSAHPPPGIPFDPAPTNDHMRSDLAGTVRDALLWLTGGDADTVSVWVWRVPGDPDPIALYSEASWANDPEVAVRDLGDAMRATVEVYAAYFETVDPGWSERALALAERLTGVEQRTAMHWVAVDGDATLFGVQVSDSYVDLRRLEALEGTWVHVTHVRD